MKKAHLIISLLLCSSVSIFGVKSEIKHTAEQLIENNRQNEVGERIQYVARRDYVALMAFNNILVSSERSQYLEKVAIRMAIIFGISAGILIGVGLYQFLTLK